MSKQLGRLAKVLISVDAGTTWLQIKAMKETTFSGSRAEIKVTSHDDGDFETYLPGRVDGSIDLKLFLDDADPGQLALCNAWLSGSSFLVHYVQHPGPTFTEYAGSGIVTKFEQMGGDNDAAAINATIRFSAALVQQDQPTTPDEIPAAGA